MSAKSLDEVKETLKTSMRKKGYYDVSSVEALLHYAESIEQRLNQLMCQNVYSSKKESQSLLTSLSVQHRAEIGEYAH